MQQKEILLPLLSTDDFPFMVVLTGIWRGYFSIRLSWRHSYLINVERLKEILTPSRKPPL
jgi:hypothetical protein